jgi:cysteinyl-tRNA synthetase
VHNLIKNVRAAFHDDLSTVNALTELFQFVTSISPGMTLSDEVFSEILFHLDGFLGLDLDDRPDITDDQKALIAEREQARERKDWAGADRLRTQLKKHNLELNDTPNGPRWRRSKI